jgi:hypothetical protein
MSDVVYVLEREQGECADRTHALVLATLDKREAEAWLARARSHEWPDRCDIWDDEHDDCAPSWELPDALGDVRAYGEPRYRLREVRMMSVALPPRERRYVVDVPVEIVRRIEVCAPCAQDALDLATHIALCAEVESDGEIEERSATSSGARVVEVSDDE